MIDDDGVAVPLTIPRQKGETDLAVNDVVLAGRRYVLTRNPEQARKDAATRTALLAGLERKLTQGDKALVGNAGYRRFLAEPTGEGFSIDAAKVEDDARFDGLFVLRTNTRLMALKVVLRYRNLLAVEQGFLAAKTLLATRPIFHRTDAAIRGHIFCTFLALVLRQELMDGWEPAISPYRNGTRSSMISPNPARSRSSRTDGAPCYAPLLDRPSTHLPSRRCR